MMAFDGCRQVFTAHDGAGLRLQASLRHLLGDQYGGDIANQLHFAPVADEGAQGPELCRHLVRKLDKLDRAYLDLRDQGDEALNRLKNDALMNLARHETY